MWALLPQEAGRERKFPGLPRNHQPGFATGNSSQLTRAAPCNRRPHV